jgi:hypothetical protein
MNRREFLRATAASVSSVAAAKALAGEAASAKPGATIRVGMIGCDTSHAIAFTQLLEKADAAGKTGGVRVVACYPSFSPDIKSSADRVDGYKKQLREQHGVEMVDSIDALLAGVDAVLLESVDGRRHLKELEPVAKAQKPVFIDKPFAASLSDAKAMVRLVKEHDVPCFSCSSLRFDSAIAGFVADEAARGKIVGCDAFSPAHLERTNPGLFWYGIHGVEILYTVMGRGCQRVGCTSVPGADFAVGVWSDGRIGTMRGLRDGKADYGASVVCEKVFSRVTASGDFYARLVEQIVKFFQTGKPPFPIDETLEICAFIDAAWRSSQVGGKEVKLDL